MEQFDKGRRCRSQNTSHKGASSPFILPPNLRHTRARRRPGECSVLRCRYDSSWVNLGTSPYPKGIDRKSLTSVSSSISGSPQSSVSGIGLNCHFGRGGFSCHAQKDSRQKIVSTHCLSCLIEEATQPVWLWLVARIKDCKHIHNIYVLTLFSIRRVEE